MASLFFKAATAFYIGSIDSPRHPATYHLCQGSGPNLSTDVGATLGRPYAVLLAIYWVGLSGWGE